MLVLTRRQGEVIKIGEDIILHVVLIKNKMIRIGIEAPPNVKISRPDAKNKESKHDEVPPIS